MWLDFISDGYCWYYWENRLHREDGIVQAWISYSEGASAEKFGFIIKSSLISIEYAELMRSTPSLVLCCAWLVTMTLHVHCGLGQLNPLPTFGDDK